MTQNDDLSNRLRHGVDRGTAPELSADLLTGAADRPTPRDPARTLRVAGSVTLGIAALAVAAVVVAPSLTPRAPLFTAAEASAGQTSAMSVEGSSDRKIGWWVDYNYSADPSLSTEPGRGEVYRLVLDATDPVQRTTALAAAFGIDGTATGAEWSDAAFPTWVVGPQDGTDKSLSFSAFGTGDWWYNDPTAASIAICDPSVTRDQADEYGCVLPADAPENLAPTGDEARALAAELFASTGYDVETKDIELYTDDWATTATAYLSVDGQRTALSWNASWSNTGELSYAYGHSVRVEAQGTFDTVSPTDAVTRLEDGRWFGSAGPDFQGGGAIAFSADVARSDGAPQDAADPTDTPTEEPVDPTVPVTEEPTDPSAPVAEEPVAPVEPVDPSSPVTPVPEETPMPEPTPEVVDVVVDNATATLVLLWDVDGNAWLVPGYAMQMDEGWWNTVVSLVDGVIELPGPMVIEPGVVDPEIVE